MNHKQSAYDPDLACRQRQHYYDNLHAEMKRREALQHKKFEDSLAVVRERSARSPEEVTELRARLDRLRSDEPAAFAVVDLDDE